MPPAAPLTVEQDLANWLKNQPRWLKHAANSILTGQELDSEALKLFVQTAFDEANGTLGKETIALNLQSLFSGSACPVRITSISDVSGIGQLNPRNPLKFGNSPVTAIFGSNGSGKSSYVRILKQVCGARLRGEIHRDVFAEGELPQSCKLTYNTSADEETVGWDPSMGIIQGLSTVDIFDAHCGHSYLANEGKATYEPRALQFLSELAALCDQISARFGVAMEKRSSKLPSLPTDYRTATIGVWYQGLSSTTPSAQIDENCTWTEDCVSELAELTKTLAERSPEDRARGLRKRKEQADSIHASLKSHIESLSDDVGDELIKLRKSVVDAQKTAELAAKANLESANLDGVGTIQWSELWAVARRYSAEVAYPEIDFPNTVEGARCVLCHQNLDEDARTRLESFDRFVADETSKTLLASKTSLNLAVQKLPVLPDDETLTAKASGAGLKDQPISDLIEFYRVTRLRLSQIVSEESPEEFEKLPAISTWGESLEAYAQECEKKAKEFIDGADATARATKETRKKELIVRQWIAPQKASIEAEVKRLGEIAQLKKGQGLCGTRSISTKKDSLATTLITPAYVSAFNAELSILGAKKIRVELVKTRVSKGVILHQVRLKGSIKNKPIQEVLSEGEHRIVCLAAFLADSVSNPNGSTFVFDDPISSLDLDFEENVVQRLVTLSQSRPVVVFTHRLSLLGMLKDYTKKADIEMTSVNIRREPWGAGEPGDEAIESDPPKKGLNHHLPARIAAAKLVYEAEGTTAYMPYAQSICTETRKIIERLVEFELLGDVIQRHRRAINTMGKLEKLASISVEDCEFIDRMMTKYSRYEHAQSSEAPVELPEPDELATDVKLLKDWRDELERRRK